ncbi:Uma2 family endonuclease [Phormidium sp. LEGE 05292]|uniref:Uma2 family endonuclease n=1 Tax=[Phormidium] sp. LEGE 05292 TaxID=767427 RepID=UPI0018802ED9|nr:Uma2 family endonuclease [Phormidium sp. LEGE 05292]MBE9225772.1 Uma2 family endonuclease [Phormidium sp. LEGE 05292]
MAVTQKLIVPPLEGGDRLSRDEFERRYAASPHIKKAELIEGVVYMAAAVRFRSHGQPHGRIITWLGVYEAATSGVALSDNGTVRLDENNEPQPDALLRIEIGGNSRVTDDDYIEGAPELVVEIAASSASYDLYDKKQAYQRNGVQEYLVWQVFEQKLDWFQLQNGNYILLQPDENGVVKSLIFPGLWLAVNELLSGNMATVLTVLQEGLNSPEYAEFIKNLLPQ